MGRFDSLGSSIGHDRVLEIARDTGSRRQLTIIGEGEGNFTAGIIRELAANCEYTRTVGAVEHVAQLWDSVGTPECKPLGVLLTGDVQIATDNVIRTLARCAGSCIDCPFKDGRPTLNDMMRINTQAEALSEG